MSKLRLSFFVLSYLFLTGLIFAAGPGAAAEDCDLNGFITFTQGGWGNPSNSVPGQIRDANFATVFPNGLLAGLEPQFNLRLTSAEAVMNFLPQGGTAGAFIQNYLNPTANTSAGVLGGQLIAAILNVSFDAQDLLGTNNLYHLGELVITTGVFQGMTVNQLLEIANTAAGGGSTGYTFAEINSALTSLNENFDNGTVDLGYLTCPAPPASIGDKVWLDNNRNGLQDDGEDGVPGVTVELYKSGNVLTGTTVTASNGYYYFENLPVGEYYLKFILPPNYAVSPENSGGDDSLDSDVDPITGLTIPTDLTEHEQDHSWDAGLYRCYASLGDRVWYDTDKDGIQDENETGVPGVVVKLFSCAGDLLNTTTTGENGYYLFSSLNPGDYYVQFILPQNYFFTLNDQGTNDSLDSDAGENGITACTNLIADENDLTWDAGIYQEGESTDLSLIKQCDNPNPQNGDIIHFTVVVTNHGPAQATNVQVIDVVPSNVIYQSYTASQGTYDAGTGLWIVGTLANGASATLEVTVQVNIEENQDVIDLGPAKGFNVFVLYDINQPSADTQGKLAAGRDAYLANYSIGDQLVNSNGTVDVLVVGRNLTYLSGAVYGGNVVYGNTTNLPVPAVSIVHGTLRQDTPIDFDAARLYLQSLSLQLAGYTVNGTTTFEWGTISLTGTDPLLNVFSVSGADLSQANNFEINVPAGSVVLVNISGTNISWMGGLTVNGTDYTNILYNFTEGGTLTLQGIDILGSILAPFTDVNFQAGVQHGQMIAKSLTGSGQFNLSFFLGHIPSEGTVVNIAEVYFADQYDPDSTPNNGVESEDDYGKVIVNVGTPGGTGNWQYIGSFIANEMVLTIINDAQGNIYAGTLGGKIYKSTDGGATWVRINESMNAVYVWTLVINASGHIFAGTELGLFKTEDGTNWTLTSLSDKDIRTLVKDNAGNLYAGAWGYGVYKSTDDGLTWTPKNSGLGSVAIHTLFFNINGELFAGAYDFGMFKTTDGGETWTTVSIPYPIIWSSGKTSTGTLFVGTYGDGMYRSTDNGNSWHRLNNLVASYIYQVITDAADNIYAGSWTGGVFASSDNGETWSGLGMPGARITSMMINPASGNLMAGTEDGRIFVISSVLSNGSNGTEIPSQFNLLQNYPNPFNPTTVIRFDIPVQGNYKIKLFNMLGQEVSTLASANYKPGRYSITINAGGLSSGVYFYTLTGENVNISRKMMLIK